MTSVEPSYSRTRSIYPRLALLAVGLFLVGTNSFVIAGLLPDIAHSLGVTTTDVSYSISLYAITVAVAAPVISILAARLSRTILMASGSGVLAAGTLVAAEAHDLTVFSIGRLIAAIGGAALVPAATAAAAAIAPPQKRGRAIAFVAVGFTMATALGSPLGTAIGAVGGWQLPIYGVAALAALLAIAIALFVRDLPIGAPIPLARRFAPLRDHRVLMALVATLCVTAGFNLVYIFSSAITHTATGGSGTLLAILLFVYGIGGIIGNIIAGLVTDRLGNRLTATIFLGAQLVLLVALAFLASDYILTAVLFFLLGVAAFASVPPIQHRLIAIDPESAVLSLSWYTTGMYVGISVAPLLGALAIGVGGAAAVPVFGAIAVALSVVTFLLGYLTRGARRASAGKVEQTA
ncbi:MAG: transporter [Microbacteriaceae bacterium]|nr:transporter [Microbacteriaceae bacterium]